MLADLLIQILQEAVEKLLDMKFHLNEHNQTTLENQDEKLSLAVILSHLQEEERNDRLSFLSTPVNETLDYAARKEMEAEVVEYLARTASFCRTALLPAQSRYDGISDDTLKEMIEDSIEGLQCQLVELKTFLSNL